MFLRHCLISSVLLVLSASHPAVPTANAAGRVELVLVTEDRVAITAQQEWLARLSQAGVSNLQIRGKQPLDKVGIEVRQMSVAPVYVVTGLITSGNELVVPGERFRATEMGRLVQWIEDLAQRGPADQREQLTAFGLTAKQFERAHEELARPVGFSTQGMTRREVVERIGRESLVSLRIEPSLLAAMGDDQVAEDLSGLSCGTALAYVVRSTGGCLVPRPGVGLSVEYAILTAKPDQEIWPVGWEPEKPRRDVLPGLFEFLNVNVQGVPVTQVLDAVGKRLDVPILIDHNATARHGIQPDEVMVSLPQRRTAYTLLLSKVLSQAKLKYELRVDEAGKPLLWITTVKPM